MLLRNLNIIGQDGLSDIRLSNSRIASVGQALTIADAHELSINFENALAFPGLINAHDHLDFDLFPQTGNRVYKSYIEWGADIQSHNRSSIDAILKIPKQLRIDWGIYKNLLTGITTVVHHGDFIRVNNPLITVFQDCYSLHSVDREKLWKLRLNQPFAKKKPYVIHAGEGTDLASMNEISELARWNLFRRRLIAIHGVAMNTEQAKEFDALIWCPASNLFLLNATARIDDLMKNTTILFGTDSTLTAPWNIWQHLRAARESKLVSDDQLFAMLTINPARIFNLQDVGELGNDRYADIVIAKTRTGNNKWDNFYDINPDDLLMVLHKGSIRLFDAGILEQVINHIALKDFSAITINGIRKYVKGDLPKLISDIRSYNGEITFPVDCD